MISCQKQYNVPGNGVSRLSNIIYSVLNTHNTRKVKKEYIKPEKYLRLPSTHGKRKKEYIKPEKYLRLPEKIAARNSPGTP